jgi:peroxiredoxin
MTTAPNRPLRPGDQAPSFALPAVNREGMVGMEDYRGKGAVLIGLFRGLHCPFCRRQITQLAITRNKLEREGVETLAIVNTPAERARQYFQYRPTRVLLAADPDVRTHRAFGLPAVEIVPDDTDPATLQWPQRIAMTPFLSLRFNPTGELPEPQNIPQASETLNQKDRFEFTEADQRMAAQPPQLTGHFLIDGQGTIRWAYVEGEKGPTDLVSFPGDDVILAAVEALPR